MEKHKKEEDWHGNVIILIWILKINAFFLLCKSLTILK